MTTPLADKFKVPICWSPTIREAEVLVSVPPDTDTELEVAPPIVPISTEEAETLPPFNTSVPLPKKPTYRVEEVVHVPLVTVTDPFDPLLLPR